ncbi:MAG: sigma factor-like helix-turn-helix DNA-binding protein [Patescibacteria group bacterium]
MTNLKNIINNFVSVFSPRQKDIIEKRFGLAGEVQTLAAVGKKYNLTRERVRQIEAMALKSIGEKLKNSAAEEFMNAALAYLEKTGGVRKEEDFLSDLKNLFGDQTISRSQLKFICEINGRPYYHPGDKDFYDFWYSSKEVFENVRAIINKLEKFLSDKKDKIILEKKFNEFFSQFIKSNNLEKSTVQNYLLISKKFAINPYGDFGLSSWDEISPKTIRAKILLILKKQGKPLHFREITKQINDIKLNKRAALPQTVHNELIRDPNFVLVGRGMYGLSEFGLMPGTAKEVIARILKSKGPMAANRIVDLVLQERFLKQNTILLNLQNKKHFKKMPDGKYQLA